ncbi:fused tRNA nucleotidyl transferase; 2'3'-cyclic phosphodiesterase and 2'nucleotidase and phosphatase [Candidatus Methylobacter favarea]|uniref:Multifunctional CCA protein n=1 Tax=Candidatus Methylobacter favarea TaxID=2707345 RepID=A0A8S0WQG5_9GAMM|nr:multifunctional CCA addition/repair protein [Candidatus Methylobacter favarea]CAA9891427.1 fused tRNA nucleotidyl transferase; 2'3'-cyclic phosphodiesterase and 2'nucleotidase and phosphatase [Candidatus Methylobacter favarea]
MEIYLVGGAVRDKLLNYPVQEKDWVVIGETPESMVKQGFRPVGKDFPVFLHPHSREEYALARTERKSSPGYKGFIVHTSPDVSLEQDLIRRDLTINAIAMTPQGQIIDPFGGKNDLEKRIFRHVSPAFSEDPVRILRVARFAARYAHLDFKLAEETRALMRQMASSGEIDHLVPERVWAELLKALSEKSPTAFFHTLKDCYALDKIFPEINRLFGVPQPEKHHPEIDTGVHTMLCLEQAALLSSSPEVRFATLVHDLGKGLTPKDQWPHHYGHEKSGLKVLENLCARLRVPNSFKSLARHVMQYHTHCHKAFELRASTLTDLLTALGAFKPANRLAEFLLACEADAKGRTGFENRLYPQAERLREATKAAASIDITPVLQSELKGDQIAEAIRRLRIKAVNEFIKA